MGGWLERAMTTAFLFLASGWLYLWGRSSGRLERSEPGLYSPDSFLQGLLDWPVSQDRMPPVISSWPFYTALSSRFCYLLPPLAVWVLSWLTTLCLLGKLYKLLWFSCSLCVHTLVNSSFIMSFSNYANFCHLFLLQPEQCTESVSTSVCVCMHPSICHLPIRWNYLALNCF